MAISLGAFDIIRDKATEQWTSNGRFQPRYIVLQEESPHVSDKVIVAQCLWNVLAFGCVFPTFVTNWNGAVSADGTGRRVLASAGSLNVFWIAKYFATCVSFDGHNALPLSAAFLKQVCILLYGSTIILLETLRAQFFAVGSTNFFK